VPARPGPGESSAAAVVVGLLLALPAWRALPPDSSPCEAASTRRLLEGVTRVVACGEPGPALRGPARLLFRQSLDLNRASADTLEVLPGIGPRRAEAIVRARGGRPFAGPRDLERVHGIGPRTASALEDLVHGGGQREEGG